MGKEKKAEDMAVFKNDIMIRGTVIRKQSTDTGIRMVILCPRIFSKKNGDRREYSVNVTYPVVTCGVDDALKVKNIALRDCVSITARAYSGLNDKRPDTFFSLRSIEKIPNKFEAGFGHRTGYAYPSADVSCLIGGRIVKCQKRVNAKNQTICWILSVETERSESETNVIRIKFYTRLSDAEVENYFKKDAFVEVLAEIVTGTTISRTDPSDPGVPDPDSGYAFLTLRECVVIDEDGVKELPRPQAPKKSKKKKGSGVLEMTDEEPVIDIDMGPDAG